MKLQSGATVALIVGKTARKVSADDAASLSLAMRWPMTSACRKRAFTARRLRPNAAMVSARSVPAPVDSVDNLTIITEINGREADSWNTGDPQRNAAELLSALSEFATLNPGDAILIGTLTPASRCSPAIACAILAEGFPALENPVVAEGELA